MSSKLIKFTPAQKAIVDALANDSSAFIRELISSYCESQRIPFPAMPGKGGDRRSVDYVSGQAFGEDTLICYVRADDFVIEPLTAENAALAVQMRYNVWINHEAGQQTVAVYLLGDDWQADDIQRVKNMLRERPVAS